MPVGAIGPVEVQTPSCLGRDSVRVFVAEIVSQYRVPVSRDLGKAIKGNCWHLHRHQFLFRCAPESQHQLAASVGERTTFKRGVRRSQISFRIGNLCDSSVVEPGGAVIADILPEAPEFDKYEHCVDQP